MKKIAIIGASYLQEPLINKAKSMGLETHVFAWKCGDIGEKIADYFYPISIIEKDKITEVCKDLGISGVITIASDLAAITTNYVAHKLGLIGNSPECSCISTNKHLMRLAFEKNGDPSVKSILVKNVEDLDEIQFNYPIIVKPLDRSGSRGITKLYSGLGLEQAIQNAKEQGFEKSALVEEFANGQEYSIECISYKGVHKFLQITQKYTTGAPHFIENGHLEPAPLDRDTLERVKLVVIHALTSLKIEYGASHTELKIDENGKITIIEVGGRMGGDCIGSDLVQISTDVDFLGDVISIALGERPKDFDDVVRNNGKVSAIRFIFNKEDIDVFKELQRDHPDWIIRSEINEITSAGVTDSSTRFGYFLFAGDNLGEVEKYLPMIQ